jgi:hypothetical protein
MVEDARKSRALLDYLVKHQRLVIAHVAGDHATHVQLERAEKRFLTAFVTNTVASILIIVSRVWGITSPTQLLHLPAGDLITLTLAAASLISLLLAWMAYFEIGISLSVERAVEIKPRDEQ